MRHAHASACTRRQALARAVSATVLRRLDASVLWQSGGQDTQDKEARQEVLAQLPRALERRGASQPPQPPGPKGDGREVEHEVHRSLAAAPLLGRQHIKQYQAFSDAHMHNLITVKVPRPGSSLTVSIGYNSSSTVSIVLNHGWAD